MNTENQEIQKPDEIIVDEGKQEQQGPSEIELKAMEMGWRPREEFNGTDDDFIDAKEFVRRKPLFDKIEHSSREVKELRKALDALKTHYTTVKESEYNRALATLKAARKDALTNGDGDQFEAIDQEIKRVEQEAVSVKQIDEIQPEPVQHPEFVGWLNRNPWYNSTPYMRQFADQVGLRLKGQMPPAEVLKEVEKAVKQEFPTKFKNPNKESAPDVDSSDGKTSRSGGFELTEQERKIMNTFVRSGVMTKEKYIADLKAAKGIK